MSASVKNLFPSSTNAIAFPAPTSIRQVEIVRPVGYALPGYKAISVTIESAGYAITGFGEGPSELAIKKAYSEAIERLALTLFCDRARVKESSNGWAAHVSKDLAVGSALFELIERDVAVQTWENGGPFFVVPTIFWPASVTAWKARQERRTEYFDLKIFLSANENGACISALLFNGRGNFVAGHASAYQLEHAIISAVNECLRAAHLAVRFEYLADVMALHSDKPNERTEPGAHSLAYAYKEAMPKCVVIEESSEKETLCLWKKHQTIFDNLDFRSIDLTFFEIGSHVVARVKCPRYRQIYWGKNHDLSKRNSYPHFVG